MTLILAKVTRYNLVNKDEAKVIPGRPDGSCLDALERLFASVVI